ncbi:transposase family protein [Streptomyces erythrochromogenes]|uniref:helix-turn-helix domain-containing protein n=1 Tax=Streptomyces erythrochromogenes TaxID=285574 RepID=UPI0036BF372E
MLIITREGDRRCKLPPHRRSLAGLVHLRKRDTLAQIAAGFGKSESTAHAHVHSVNTHPCRPRSPAHPRTRAPRQARPEYLLVDGTPAECDRVGNGQDDHSGKHRKHRVYIHAVTGAAGRLI